MNILTCVSTPGVTVAPCPTGQSLMLVDVLGFSMTPAEAGVLTSSLCIAVVGFYVMGKGFGMLLAMIKRG